LEKWEELCDYQEDIRKYVIELAEKWKNYLSKPEVDHSKYIPRLYRWLEARNSHVRRAFLLVIIEGWNSVWQSKRLDFKAEKLNKMLNSQPKDLHKLVKTYGLAENFKRNSKKLDAFMLGVKILENEFIQDFVEQDDSDSVDSDMLDNINGIRTLRPHVGAWLCILMRHKPLEVYNSQASYSLYELSARAIVSKLQEDVLVNIHLLQPLPSDFILEDVLFRLAIACCVKYMKLEDLPSLKEILELSYEKAASDLLQLIISCKGQPQLVSFEEIKRTAPNWITELVYDHIKTTDYPNFGDSLECLKMILSQEGVSRSMEYARKFTTSAHYIKMVKLFATEVSLDKLSENELIEVIRMVEGSLWIPHQIKKIHKARQMLPIFGFWFSINANTLDFTDFGDFDEESNTILEAIRGICPDVALYLSEMKNSYSQLMGLISTMTSNHKTYQRVTELLKKLKPHFYASSRETEWEDLIKLIKTKHRQKKKLQGMIVSQVDKISISTKDWFQRFKI